VFEKCEEESGNPCHAHQSTSDPVSSGPSDEDETAEHKAIAAKLRETRQTALELLEKHLPRIEHRLKELDGKKELDALESSQVYRIRAGSPGSPNPLASYRQCLEDIKSSCEIRLDGCFVRIAEACADLAVIQKKLDDVLKVAEQCARCADDVCHGPDTVEG
jgi:hypothetical protein